MLSLFDCLDPYWPSWTAVTVFGQDPIGVYIIIYAFSACRLRRSGVLQKLSKRPLAKWHLVHVTGAMWCSALPICWHLFGVSRTPSGEFGEWLFIAVRPCEADIGFIFDLGYSLLQEYQKVGQTAWAKGRSHSQRTCRPHLKSSRTWENCLTLMYILRMSYHSFSKNQGFVGRCENHRSRRWIRSATDRTGTQAIQWCRSRLFTLPCDC